jgi:ferredoxin-NADP reductase
MQMQRLRPSAMDCIGTVLASEQLTPTIKSIRLRLDQTEFSFLPGQSIWPCFEREGRQFKKIYSIASSPSRCPEVELCVSRVGWSSAYLQDLAVGETIQSRGPYGLMTLDRLPSRPRLYIAEGSGIAPLKSQIDWLYDQGFNLPVWLIQANPETPDQLPYAAYWRSLAQIWHCFHYVESINTCPEFIMTAQPINWAEFDIEICGVNDRPIELQNAALAMGAKPEQIRFEKFVAF